MVLLSILVISGLFLGAVVFLWGLLSLTLWWNTDCPKMGPAIGTVIGALILLGSAIIMY